MRYFWNLNLGIALLLAVPCFSRAELMLSLSSSSNLTAVQVGQTVTIDIQLSGIADVGGSLDFLGGTVEIMPPSSGSLFSSPFQSIGAIVPDGTGFFGATSTGYADASYDTLFAASGTPILSDGIFYSIALTAQSPGSGTFNLTFAGAFVGFNEVPIQTGNVLPFTIVSSTTQAVQTPEPSGLMVALLIVPILLLFLIVSRKRSRGSSLHRRSTAQYVLAAG